MPNPTKCAEARANHGMENFGDSLYRYEEHGRHVETRTPDLYRVKSLVIGNSTTYRPSRTAKITDNPSHSVAKMESVRNEKRSPLDEIWKITEPKVAGDWQ